MTSGRLWWSLANIKQKTVSHSPATMRNWMLPTTTRVQKCVLPHSSIQMRMWDRLGPVTLCCSACPWTNVSCSNKIQRNYEGLEAAVHAKLGQVMGNKIQKNQKKKTKTQLPLLRCWSNSRVLSVAPAYSTPRGVGRACKLPLSPCKAPGCPRPLTQGVSKGNHNLFFDPFALRVPLKPCLNFSSGLLSISLD